jgi:hypothetical protein
MLEVRGKHSHLYILGVEVHNRGCVDCVETLEMSGFVQLPAGPLLVTWDQLTEEQTEADTSRDHALYRLTKIGIC